MLTWTTISGLVRHALTFLGGFAVAQGWVDEATMTEVVGALMTIIGTAWSVWAKKV